MISKNKIQKINKEILTELTKYSFSDIYALKELCQFKMSYHQRCFPPIVNKHRTNKHIYKEQYNEWHKWFSLMNKLDYEIQRRTKPLLAVSN